jgi:hypothetical protein
LTSTRIYFYNCWQRIKKKCEFFGKANGPIRFHYSDVRAGVIHTQTDSKDRIIINKLHELDTLEPNKIKKKDIEFVITLLDEFAKGNVDFFFRLTKIDRQLREIKDSSIVARLKLYMILHMKFRTEEIIDIRKMMTTLLNNYSKATTGGAAFIGLYNEITGPILAPLFDIYTIARMIRFDMKRVIIYAGQGHTEPMKNFLIEMFGFQSTVSQKSNNRFSNSFQCISLKNVPQPWFPIK